jgi:hypothetical protein
MNFKEIFNSFIYTNKMNNSPILSVPTNTPTTPNYIGTKNVVRRRSKTIDGNSKENQVYKRPPTPYIFPQSSKSNLDELDGFELPKPAIKIERERSYSVAIPLKK